jgi:hypothetical protein
LLGHHGNDLEAPGIAIEPAIAAVEAALRQSAECALARMSGSGSACLGFLKRGPQRRRRLAPWHRRTQDGGCERCDLASIVFELRNSFAACEVSGGYCALFPRERFAQIARRLPKKSTAAPKHPRWHQSEKKRDLRRAFCFL